MTSELMTSGVICRLGTNDLWGSLSPPGETNDLWGSLSLGWFVPTWGAGDLWGDLSLDTVFVRTHYARNT